MPEERAPGVAADRAVAAPEDDRAPAPHVILFADFTLGGAHKHVFGPTRRLPGFNDGTSSIVVLAGNWVFYRDPEFENRLQPVLGPGIYNDVTSLGIPNDVISSLRPTTAPATVSGAPIEDHVILFADFALGGAHRHVFGSAQSLPGFNDGTSSIVVLAGNWVFYRDPEFENRLQPVLGPGIYNDVTSLGIPNDVISSLRPTTAPATVSGAPIEDHVILFADFALGGAHRHVFGSAQSLPGFNDGTSSIVVLAGNWVFYRDPGFRNRLRPVLGPGIYNDVTSLGIPNDVISSLHLSTSASWGNGPPPPAHAILYEAPDLHGTHKHVLSPEPSLAADSFDNKAASVVVLAGNWQFFSDPDFGSPVGQILGPGVYPDLGAEGIPPGTVSSMLPTSDAPAQPSSPPRNEIIVFNGYDFTGEHVHVFGPKPDLYLENSFYQKAASLIVISGTWTLYRGPDLEVPYPITVGPGVYATVDLLGINDEVVQSLQPTGGSPPIPTHPVPSLAMIFDQPNFRGNHLVAPDTVTFGQITPIASIAVLKGNWRFRPLEFYVTTALVGPGAWAYAELLGIETGGSLETTTSLHIISPYPGGRYYEGRLGDSVAYTFEGELEPSTAISFEAEGWTKTILVPTQAAGDDHTVNLGVLSHLRWGTHAINASATVWSMEQRAYVPVTTSRSYLVRILDPPTAQFDATPVSGQAPLTVQFHDHSSDTTTSWAWTFGDGSTSTSQNPSHTYAGDGWYTVSLTAQNEVGWDRKTKPGYIRLTQPPPPPTDGYSQVEVNNCHDEQRSIIVWLLDLTESTYQEQGTLESQWDTSGYCPAVNTSPLLIPLQTNHEYMIIAVDTAQIGCPGNEPDNPVCQRQQFGPITGNSDGPTYPLTIS
jgi:hypothetical protein